jgi:hypothetical protein
MSSASDIVKISEGGLILGKSPDSFTNSPSNDEEKSPYLGK